MQCTNCGMIVPAVGNVCPYCNQDKTADLKRTLRLEAQLQEEKARVRRGAMVFALVALIVVLIVSYMSRQ